MDTAIDLDGIVGQAYLDQGGSLLRYLSTRRLLELLRQPPHALLDGPGAHDRDPRGLFRTLGKEHCGAQRERHHHGESE